MTDLNDVTVLATAIARGGDAAINIDETPASTWDRVAAIGGLVIPAVSGSLVKKVGKESVSAIGKVAGNIIKKAEDVLSVSDILRIENASTRINKPINVIGSRAAGTAKAGSDWDYIIDNINSKEWSKI